MADLPRFATAPGHVRALDFEHVLVLINYRTGQVQCLLPAAATLWCDAAATGRLDTLPSRFAAQLLGAGLLNATSSPVPWASPVTARAVTASWGGTEHPAGSVRPAPTGTTAAAVAALGLIFAIKRAGAPRTAMQRITTALRAATSTGHQLATPEQATAAVHAVRHAAWYSPARTACLEESAATVLFLAARRLTVTWCHGVAPDPVRLHAWVQTEDGTPIAEPPSTLAYTPALTIGARHQHQP